MTTFSPSSLSSLGHLYCPLPFGLSARRKFRAVGLPRCAALRPKAGMLRGRGEEEEGGAPPQNGKTF